jgi:hypothetical protein
LNIAALQEGSYDFCAQAAVRTGIKAPRHDNWRKITVSLIDHRVKTCNGLLQQLSNVRRVEY